MLPTGAHEDAKISLFVVLARSAICKVHRTNLCSLVHLFCRPLFAAAATALDARRCRWRCSCYDKEESAEQKILAPASRAVYISLLASLAASLDLHKFHSCVTRKASQHMKPRTLDALKVFMTISLRQ
jgi:hypothetical protein